jgi:hypothetical protein
MFFGMYRRNEAAFILVCGNIGVVQRAAYG